MLVSGEITSLSASDGEDVPRTRTDFFTPFRAGNSLVEMLH